MHLPRRPLFVLALLSVSLSARPGLAQATPNTTPPEIRAVTPSPSPALAPTLTAKAAAPELRVAAVGSKPFTFLNGGEVRGLSIDIWREVAGRIGAKYKVERFSSVEAALRAVADHQLDVAIGPLSITSERAKLVAFSQPYFHSSLSILANARSQALWDRLEPFVNRAFLAGSAMLLFILSGVGTLVWLAERKHNGSFSRSPLQGIGGGTWFALVTMTTVGYGDKAPVTSVGRIIAGVWMIISLLTISSLTGAIATALTLAQLDQGAIESADQLRDRRVAALEGTVGSSFVTKKEGRLIKVKTVQQAIDRVLEGKAEAVVHDRPMLMFFLSHHPEADLKLSEANYEPQGYGLAVDPARPELLHRINVALLKTLEEGAGEKIFARWLAEG